MTRGICNFRNWLALRPWTRHSLILLVGGLVYFVLGVGMFITDELTLRQQLVLETALRIFFIQTWGLVFMAGGVLVGLSARWPSFSDSWGYAVLTGLASGWSAMYFTGYFFGDSPESNIISGVVWGLAAFLWWAISGFPNPTGQRRRNDGST